MPKVFIENEAGKAIKNLHHEKTLEFRKAVTVMLPYPYPYGFILNTTSGDGDNLDCFVLTVTALRRGDIVEVVPIGLMEQVEDGEIDHKIIAILAGELVKLDQTVQEQLRAFAMGVFSDIPGKQMEVGRFLPASEATALIANCAD